MPLQPSQISVRELLEMIFQNKWWFIACTVLGFLLSVLALQKMDRVFQSEAEILVEDRQANDPLMRGLGVSTSVQQRFNTVRAIILSKNALMDMAQQLNLPEYTPDPSRSDDLSRAVANTISVSLIQGNRIRIHVERRTPDEAKRIVEHISGAIENENLDIRENEINTSKLLLKSLLDEFGGKLNEAEMVLKNFNELHMLDLSGLPTQEALSDIQGIRADSAGAPSLLSEMQQLLTQQRTNATKISSLDAKYQEITARINSQTPFTVTQRTSEPSELRKRLEVQLAQATSELAEMQAKKDMSDDHILVQEKKDEIQRYAEQLSGAQEPVVVTETQGVNREAEEMRVQAASLRAEIAALESEQLALQQQVDELAPRIKAIPEKQLEKADKERERNIVAQLYRDIRMRYENANLTSRLEKADRDTRFRLLDPPSWEPKPIRPNPKFVYAMGIFLGMVAGLALCFVREFTDTSFRNLDDASRYLDLPVLGVIPEVTNSTTRQRRRRRRNALTRNLADV